MKSKQLEEETILRAIQLAPHRPVELFRDFLPKGYKMFQLDTVQEHYSDELHLAKVQLGILITLLDDLVDHPEYRNPQRLVRFFAELSLGVNVDAVKMTEPLHLLFSEFLENISRFPHYPVLKKLFDFDLEVKPLI